MPASAARDTAGPVTLTTEWDWFSETQYYVIEQLHLIVVKANAILNYHSGVSSIEEIPWRKQITAELQCNHHQ